MGSCGYEQRPPLIKLDKFHAAYLHEGAVMCYPRCDRFGEIQTLRSTKEGMYRIIMAARLGKNTVKMQTVSVQCRIMSSLADFELYDGANFTLQTNMCPIIDHYDTHHTQVLFHITTEKKGSLMAKIYRFESFRDVRLKQGIYQIWLHQSLDRPSLVDHFIMSRGTMNALVMVFKYFECSLLDIVQYRKQALEYGWTEAQVLFIWMKLIKGYRQLRQSNIFHRDLRLANLYFTPANSADPLQWGNLSAARRMTSLQLNEQDRELLTVRGVSCFAEELRGSIEAGQELGDYDPLRHDMACLERVMLAVLNLDPYEEKRECKNQMLLPWLEKIKNATGTNELAEVEGAIEKVLRGQAVNLNEMLLTDREISEELAKKLLVRHHRPLIEEVYLRNLLLLHKRDIFNKYLLDKMEENEREDKKELNLDLLHQIGEYYQSIGIADNDYYKEEITLVLDLAKEFRLEHFMTNHEQFIEKTMFLMEKYRYKGQDLRVRLKIEVVYSCLEAGDISMANQQLNQLLTMAHRQNALELPIQAEALIAKAMVQTTVHNWQAAETTLQRASVIINEGRNFVTQLEHKRLKGDLLLLQGYHYLRYLKEERSILPKPKYLGLAEESIGGALQTFLNLPQTPTNTVRIVDGYLLQAGLFIELQKHSQAKKALDACNLLLQELSTKHKVAIGLRRVVYEKLKVVTSPTDHSYPTVCRRLGQFTEADLTTKDVHVRILTSLAQSKKEHKQIKRLEQSIIIKEEAAELEHDKA